MTSLRLLLVDNEPVFLKATAALLRTDGYTCDTATSVLEATFLLCLNTYDLLITDMLMPGNVGLEFFTQLPNIVPDLPVIVISERSFSPAEGYKLGLKVVAALKKPLEL
jgi:CheY-like chemotaxis protein